MEPYDISAMPSWHFDLGDILERNQKVRECSWKAFIEKCRECSALQSELDVARAELEQSRRWIQYYKTEAERIKREYGFYLVTKSAS